MAHLCQTTLSLILVIYISRVDAPGETVRVKVGGEAILPCNLDTSLDNITLKVKWECGKMVVHLHRSFQDDNSTQDNKFKSRTSLFYDKLDKGDASLKLTKVTEQDAGNYTCTVHNKIFSTPQKRYITLELLKNGDTKNQTDNRDPEENRNKGNQIDSGLYGLFALIPVAAIVGFVIWCVQNRRGEGERQPPQQPDPQAGNVQPAPPAGQGGGEPQEEHELAAVDNIDPDPLEGQGGAEPQEESELSAIAGNIQPGAGRDGRGQHEQVETDDSGDEGQKSGAGPDGKGQYEQVEKDEVAY